MKRLLFVALTLLLCGAATANATLIAIDPLGDVYHINEVTGSETLVGNTGFQGHNNLARDSVSGTLYSTAVDGLMTIDPLTGVGTLIGGTKKSVTGLALSPDGLLYGITNTFFGVILLTIDPLTGVQTDLGPLLGGLDTVQSLTFVDDVLYGYDLRLTAGLFTIDIATLTATNLPNMDTFQNVQGMGTSADGTFIWGIGRSFAGGLVRLDPVSGEETFALPVFANTQYRGVEDLGVLALPPGPTTTVPEPSTLGLLGAGLLGLGFIRRRRAA